MIRTPRGSLFLAKNYIIELFVKPDEYRKYPTIRRIKAKDHLVTIGYKNQVMDSEIPRHKEYKLLSIWHPIDEKKPCKLRDWLVETGEFAKLFGAELKAGAKPSMPAYRILYKLKGSDIYGLTKTKTIESDLIEEFSDEEVEELLESIISGRGML